MPRLKHKTKGARRHIWVAGRQLEVADQIENLSRFVQICLDIAPDIMAWAILKEHEPLKYDTGRQLSEVIDEYNKQNPVDPLTQKRNGTWPKNSPKRQEMW